MIGAKLALLVLLGQVPATDPSALVAQLGSGRYAQRQAAAAALEQLGRRSLPVLRAAKDDKDAEVRSRAQALISKIEGALLTQPTMLSLDYQERPLAEIVKSFSDQSGIRMAIFPEQSPALQQKRVTLHETGPMPFWKALDRLCEVGQLQYNFGLHAMPNTREPVLPLFAGAGRPAGPMCDTGPFRVNLMGIHYQRNVSFLSTAVPHRGAIAPIAAGEERFSPAYNEQFYAQLQVAAEPRLSLSQHAQLKLTEAVDNLDQSLLIPPNSNGTVQRFSGYFGLTTGSTLHLQAPLRRPSQPGQKIKRLRGVLPVLVSTRKPDPLVVPLSGSAGKSFQNEEVTLGVQEIRVNPSTRQTSIELSLKTNPGPVGSEPVGAFLPTGAVHRQDTNQQQIEVVDSQGRPIPWYHSNDGESSRMTLTLTPHDQGAPAEIRYYGMVRALSEVSFEFTDIPLP